MQVCIVGLGTIGGFLSVFISDLPEIKHLTLIDYDRVEEKNLKNTVFRKKHVGMLKVNAVEDIINEETINKVTLTKHSNEFIEDQHDIDLSKYDYVIDCRDFTYDRQKVNIRLYFSGRQLIVDCRKSATYKTPIEGLYISCLSKSDVIGAVNSVVSLFRRKIIDKFIKDKIVYRFELDGSNIEACQYIDRRLETPDILYESCDKIPGKSENILINLHENIQPILEMNKTTNMTIYVGTKDSPTVIKNLPAGSLKTFSDVITNLLNTVNLPFSYDYYIVSSGKNFVELIPETGAA